MFLLGEGKRIDLRLASLVAVVSLTGLSGSDRCIINKLEKVLSVAGNDGELLAVFAHGIELICESCLELLTGDVGELGFGDKRLGLSTYELLFENNNLGGVGLLVLQLSDLVGDLLLAYMIVSVALVARMWLTYGHGWAGRKPQYCECS